MDAPGQVLSMARKAHGEILRWRDDGVQFIVLLTDGRKLYEPIGKSKPEPKPRPSVIASEAKQSRSSKVAKGKDLDLPAPSTLVTGP